MTYKWDPTDKCIEDSWTSEITQSKLWEREKKADTREREVADYK